MAGERSENQQQEKAEEETPLHGDLFVDIFSCLLPTIHLVPSSYVSRSWEHAVISCMRNPSRAKPWLIVHMQNPRNLSLVITHAYDPGSNVWIEFTRPSTTSYTSSILSSCSNTLYMLTPSKFSFSTDPLHETWHEVASWRSFCPIQSSLRLFKCLDCWIICCLYRTTNLSDAAIVGSYVVVAGGAYDFEEAPLAVELYGIASRGWFMYQPLPIMLRNSAAASWLSVDVQDNKMYLFDKLSGKLCWLDTNTKIWSEGCITLTLHPDTSIYFSVFGFAGDRLILVGLLGDSENARSLGIWEVNCNGFDCEEIGKMPREMFERLKNVNPVLSSIGISLAENFIYIHDSFYPRDIFFLDLTTGACEWGCVRSSFLDDRGLMNVFTFTCSKIGLGDLRKAFESSSRRFSVQSAEKNVFE
ncbi:hypothetical protein MKX03_036929 [Papaver bracteatum]|nr:hypothetical protein MKX03_036929 [Papaver bracteatum]